MLSQMYVRLHVKCILFFQILFKLEFSRQNFEKYSNIEFRENPSSGNPVIPSRRTDGHTDRQTDMTTQIVAFLQFANSPKIAT